MADDSKFILEIELDGRNAARQAAEIAASIAALNGGLEKSDRNLAAAERALARFSTNTGEAAVTQREAGNQTQLYNKYLYEQGRALGNVTTQLEVYKRAQSAATREARQASAASLSGNLSHIPANTNGGSGAPSLAAGSAFGAIVDEDAKAAAQAGRNYHNLSTAMDDVIAARQRESSTFASQLKAQMQEAEAVKVTEGAHNRLGQSLSTTRYAAFSAAGTLGLLSAGMVALGIASIAVASSWERSFANVVRTSDGLRKNAEAAAALRVQFVDLAQTIPLSFEALSSIGTLGNQLGVPGKDLASFTKIVAEFSATTGVSTDDAATAFGRLDSLLPGVAHNYNALGSAILKVGVNSVATEAEIIKTSTQIAAMSNQAGLTTPQVVGLAGAFASVGVMPELARGTTTRLFSLMGKAAADGGAKLDAFAKVAGVSSKEFHDAYGTPEFGAVFLKFMNGLHESGGNANQVLGELGINSVRDRPALLNLANAANSAGQAGALLAQTMGDASKGFQDQTAVADQYAVIAATVASRVQILGNNFAALLDAIGSNGLGPVGDFINGISSAVGHLTDFASTDVGGAVLGWGIAILTLTGILTGLAAVVALGFAGVVGLQQALVGLNSAAVAPGVSGLTAQLSAMAGSSGIARVAVTGLSVAMKALGVAAVAFASIEIASGITKGIGDISYAMKGLDTGFGASLTRVQQNMAGIGKYFNAGELAANFNRGFAAFTGDTVLRDIAKVDEGLRDLAKNGGAVDAASQLTSMSNALLAQKIPLSSVKAAYTDTFAALDAAGFKIEKVKGGLINIIPPTEEAARANGDLATAEDLAAQAADDLGHRLGLSEQNYGTVGEQVKALTDNLKTGSSGFVDYGDIIQRSQDKTKAWAEEQSKSKYKSKDSWQEWYDGVSVNINDFASVLQEQITKQGVWATDMKTLAGRGATAFVTELAKMGPEGAPVAAAAVKMTTDELNKLEGNARIAAFLASQAYADTLASDMGTMAEVFKQGGIDALQAFTDAQVSGVPGAVQAVIDKFHLTLTDFPVTVNTKADTTEAQQNLDTFIQQKRDAGVDVSVLTGDAQRGLDTFVNSPRTAIIDSTALTGDAQKALDYLVSSPRTALFPAKAENVDPTKNILNTLANPRTANMEAKGTNTDPTKNLLNDIAKNRTAFMEAQASNVGSTDATLNNLARTRTATIKVDTNGFTQLSGSFGGGSGGGGGMATGGYVSGAGTGTSDSIPARLSNGEYVVKAASVRQYGTGFLDALNRGVARFAGGGQVGRYAAGGHVSHGSGGPIMVELSARDRQLLARIPDGLRLQIGNQVIQRAGNAANMNDGTRGSN